MDGQGVRGIGCARGHGQSNRNSRSCHFVGWIESSSLIKRLAERSVLLNVAEQNQREVLWTVGHV